MRGFEEETSKYRTRYGEAPGTGNHEGASSVVDVRVVVQWIDYREVLVDSNEQDGEDGSCVEASRYALAHRTDDLRGCYHHGVSQDDRQQ